jgi:hypothetical protein
MKKYKITFLMISQGHYFKNEIKEIQGTLHIHENYYSIIDDKGKKHLFPINNIYIEEI